MGCQHSNPSGSSAVAGTARKIKRSHSHDFETVGRDNLQKKEIARLEEEERQRAKAEKELAECLKEERQLLRAKAQFLIMQKSTWDSLLSKLRKEELESIRSNSDVVLTYRMQHEYKQHVRREEYANKTQQWIVSVPFYMLSTSWTIIFYMFLSYLCNIFNNLSAISTADVESVAAFLSKAIQLVMTTLPPELREVGGPESLKEVKTGADNRVKEHILSLYVLYVQPFSSQEVTTTNLYDFDLPSGLSCIGTALCIMDLYKRGGRLSMGAVHKILRLAYASLKQQSNINYVNLTSHDAKITVIGDLHGQLLDLLYIIESNGIPSAQNYYLFNGDFVDRGMHGVEVMCILLALHSAAPDYVLMNRGNHEDFAICNAYGFQAECLEKYDDITFGMFMEVFQFLPMFTIINDAVFVVHGGLFHHQDVLLEDLQQINRSDFSLLDMPQGGDGIEAMPRSDRIAFLSQLQRDALWSDPTDRSGMHMSGRGAGVIFGPDIVRTFLQNNNLRMIIRSHECVRSGFYQPFTGDDKDILCTIFSASDYGGAGNSAAYLTFNTYDEAFLEKTREAAKESAEEGQNNEPNFVPNSNLMFNAHYYYINTNGQTDVDIENLEFSDDDITVLGSNNEGNTNNHPSDCKQSSLESAIGTTIPGRTYPDGTNDKDNTTSNSNSNTAGDSSIADTANATAATKSDGFFVGSTQSLFVFIMNNKVALYNAFLDVDVLQEGLVSVNDWVMVMRDTLHMDLKWNRFVSILVSPSHYRPDSSGIQCIAYLDFLNSFSENLFGSEKLVFLNGVLCRQSDRQVAVESLPPTGYRSYNNISQEMLDLIYTSFYKKLEITFDYFDTDKDGIINKEDILRGYKQLMGSGEETVNMDRIVDSMDFFKTGEIDINIFFEIFRITVGPNEVNMPSSESKGDFMIRREKSQPLMQRAASLSLPRASSHRWSRTSSQESAEVEVVTVQQMGVVIPHAGIAIDAEDIAEEKTDAEEVKLIIDI
eukprot:gene30269-39489_t